MQSLSRCVSGPSGVTRSRLSVVVVRPLRGVAIAGTSAYDDRRSRDRYSYGHIYITPRVNRIPRRLDSASACALLDRSLAVAAHKAMLSASLMFSVQQSLSLALCRVVSIRRRVCLSRETCKALLISLSHKTNESPSRRRSAPSRTRRRRLGPASSRSKSRRPYDITRVPLVCRRCVEARALTVAPKKAARSLARRRT